MGIWWLYKLYIWLVVTGTWLDYMTFPSYWEGHNPNWRIINYIIFFRGVGSKPPTRLTFHKNHGCFIVKSMFDATMLKSPQPQERFFLGGASGGLQRFLGFAAHGLGPASFEQRESKAGKWENQRKKLEIFQHHGSYGQYSWLITINRG